MRESDWIHLRQADEIDGLERAFLRKPGPGPGPFPFDVILLNTADAIDLDDDGIGTVGTQAAWRNLLNTKVSTNPDFLRCSADFCFFWTPTRSGALRAVSWLIANGAAESDLDANCFEDSNVGLVTAASLAIQQIDPAGRLQASLPVSISVFEKWIYHQPPSHCLGDHGMASIDSVLALDTDFTAQAAPNPPLAFPVVAGADVLDTVTILVRVSHYRAAATLDYSTGQRGLIVPGVVLNLF